MRWPAPQPPRLPGALGRARRRRLLTEGGQLYAEIFARAIRPDPPVRVSTWADTRRILGGDESHMPGEWRTSRAPYLREIMDRLGPDDPVQRIVFMKPARIGGSEVWVNWIGFCAELSPSAILMVSPGNPEAKAASKERIAPMVRQCPTLRDRFAESSQKDGKNTILVKEFDGGRLIMTGANSAPGLSWRSVRRLAADEIDQWPDDVGGEGDPLKLAEMRCSTFGDRCKMFETSAPTKKGASRIERLFLATDQRRFFIPCPECGHMDFITWDGKDWFGSSAGIHHRIAWDSEPEHQPDTARMECGQCQALVEEHWKPWMLERGEWRATAIAVTQDIRTSGYHLSGLYSPLGWGLSWRRIVREFLQSKNDPIAFQVWVNKRLGETWEDRTERVDEPHELLRKVEDGGRRTGYPPVDLATGGRAWAVPEGVGILLAAVDKQANWLETVVIGYGAGEESWLIDWTRFEGDTSRESVWLELDEYLRGAYRHQSGRALRIEAFAVDSKYQPDNVYEFCKAREHRRFADGFEQRGFAIAGSTLMQRPLVVSVAINKRTRCKVFSICTDTAKGMVYRRLRVPKPGPGFMHLPEWADLEYVEGLTAEKKIPQGSSYKWKKVRARNEILDLNGYALALLHILGPVVRQNLARRAAAFAKNLEGPPPDTTAAAAPRVPAPVNPVTGVRRGGWMSRVKR